MRSWFLASIGVELRLSCSDAGSVFCRDYPDVESNWAVAGSRLSTDDDRRRLSHPRERRGVPFVRASASCADGATLITLSTGATPSGWERLPLGARFTSPAGSSAPTQGPSLPNTITFDAWTDLDVDVNVSVGPPTLVARSTTSRSSGAVSRSVPCVRRCGTQLRRTSVGPRVPRRVRQRRLRRDAMTFSAASPSSRSRSSGAA